MSSPLGSSPLSAMHLSIPTNGPPEVQYQRLMELAQVFQGMALSTRLSLASFAPKVTLHFAPAFQTSPTAPPPQPSPQMLSTPVMGAQPPPLAFTPLTAQHTPSPLGG